MKKISILMTTLALTACGTIFSGTSQDISISSNVTGADVYVNNIKRCVTPCTFKEGKGTQDLLIVLKKDGYDDEQLTAPSTINIIALLDIFTTTSATTDVLTGGAFEYRPNQFYVTMQKKGSSAVDRRQQTEKSAVEVYVLANYADLAKEAAKGTAGEHVKTLSQKSGIAAEKVTTLINKTDSADELIERLKALL